MKFSKLAKLTNINEDNEVNIKNIATSKIKLLFSCIDIVRNGKTVINYYNDIIDFADKESDQLGVEDMLISVIESPAKPSSKKEPVIYDGLNHIVYGVETGKIDGDKLQKMAKNCVFYITDEELAKKLNII
jgi:hypothetical protein